MLKKLTMSLMFIFLFGGSVFAGDSLKEAFKEGKPYLDVRYRFEHVNQSGLAKEAAASTLRTRLGYQSGNFYDFMGVLEFENIVEIGDDNYNNTLNGKTNRPVIADVRNTEINQVFLKYMGFDDTEFKVGRQVITLDNHRFVGHVGWRQNNQTFDGLTMMNKSLPDTTIKYGYINNVNRIFGDDSSMGDFESNSHYYNISNSALPIGTVTTYGYFLDFENDSPAMSNQTFGISLVGQQSVNDNVDFKYRGEYAFQTDHGKNPTSYDAHYYHIAPALVVNGLTATVGYEVLGSDNSTAGFSTPLATLHKFNGWADVFLGTPAAGLEDIYFDLTYKVSGMDDNLEFLNGLLAKIQYHDFSANDGGGDYGTEWGVYLKQPIKENMYAEVKYADYNSDGFATDREKITLGFGVKY